MPRMPGTTAAMVAGALAVAAVSADADERAELTGEDWAPIAKEHWEGHVDVPSGRVKWAGWRDVRIRIEREVDRSRLLAFAVHDRALLPEEGRAPENPSWMGERLLLDEQEGWIPLHERASPAVRLRQGDRTLMLGVADDEDKRGGVVLYWIHGPPPEEPREIVAPSLRVLSEKTLRAWGEDLQPEVVPLVTRRRKDTWLVATKGKTIVGVVRYKPAEKGGDPYDRLLSWVAPEDLAKAKGTFELTPREPDRKLRKFVEERTPRDWTPDATDALVEVDDVAILVRPHEDPEEGPAYLVYTRPPPERKGLLDDGE